MVSSTDRILPRAVQDEGEEEEDLEVKVLEEQATFDEVMVWGHEVVVDEGSDPYVRGVEEWIGFAEQVRSIDLDLCRFYWLLGKFLIGGDRFIPMKRAPQRPKRKRNRGACGTEPGRAMIALERRYGYQDTTNG